MKLQEKWETIGKVRAYIIQVDHGLPIKRDGRSLKPLLIGNKKSAAFIHN